MKMENETTNAFIRRLLPRYCTSSSYNKERRACVALHLREHWGLTIITFSSLPFSSRITLTRRRCRCRRNPRPLESQLDTRLVQPHRPKSAGGRLGAGGVDAFKEVREAARRINNLSLKKGNTFSSAPKSYDMSKKLSENRKARMAADPIHAFHAKQLSNMQRRIAEQGSVTERKKNKMDARVYPVMIRKQSDKKPPWGFGGTLSHAAVPSTATTPMTTPRPMSARGASDRDRTVRGIGGGGGGGGGGGAGGKVKNQSTARPQSAGAAGVRRTPERVNGAEYMAATRKDVKSHPAYQTLRKKMLLEIVRKDANEEELEKIFQEATRQHSGSQHRHVVARVIADLRVELEVAP